MAFTETFGGTTIYPSDVSYRSISLSANQELSWPLEVATSGNVVAQIMDVTPSAGGFTITMPPANEASPGETALFFNAGSFNFTVADNAGNTIVAITPGLAYQVYLTTNTTVAGTWRTTQFGAGTSSATAGSLVGAGIKAINTTLNQSMAVTSLSVNYTAGAADRSAAFLWTGGAGTITLPAASTVGNDWFFHIRNGGTGAISLATTGGELINGTATVDFNPGDSAIIVCDGTGYFTIGFGQAPEFLFDYVSIDLTSQSSPYTLAGSNLNRIAYQFSGTLTTNMEIIVPATIQQYWVGNFTTGGSYTLTVKTSAGTGVVVPRDARAILYCNGTDVVTADTGGISIPILVSQGGTGATNASSARTNLGATSIGNALFIAVDEATARNAIIAAKSGANSDITSLTGLTTPLSVPQGGTGAATFTANGLIYGSGTSALGVTAVGTTGQVLVGNTGGAPSWATLSGIGVTSFSAGTTGLTPSAATSGAITLAGTLIVANGGTGATTLTGYVKGSGTSALTASATIPATDISGGAALTKTDDTNVTLTLGGTPASALLAATSLTLGWSGQLSVARGGTGASTLTANGVLYGAGTSAIAATAVGTTGQVLVGNTGAAPSWATLTGIGVTSFSAGTTGLTPNTATTGAITLAGTLGVANGGTGTGTAFTAGSVVFAGASGVYSQDNANLFWDNTNDRLGIGTATPSANLTIGGVGGAPAGSNIDLTGYNSFAHALMLSSAGSSAVDFIVGTSSAIPLILNTNSAERMRITSAGDVGIGTSSPGSKLSVVGTINASDGTNGNIRAYVDGTSAYLQSLNQAANAYRPLLAMGSTVSFANNGVTNMTIDTSGNVGVGVTPLANTRLYVRTAAVTDTAYYADNGANSGFKVKFASSTTSILNDFGADLVLGTSDTERMRISAGGNVGIGTSSPVTRLTVDGGAASLRTGNQFRFYPTANNNYSQIYNPTGGQMAFDSGAGEAMRIDGSGNVGIGTSSPAAPLQVASTNTNSYGAFVASAIGVTRVGNGSRGALVDFGVGGGLFSNWYYNSASDKAAAAGYSPRIDLWVSDGSIRFVGSTSVAADATIAWSERMRINSSGELSLQNGNIYGPNGNTGGISVYGGAAFNTGAGITLTGQSNANPNNIIFTTGAYVERARIDSSGNLLVGKTAANDTTLGAELQGVGTVVSTRSGSTNAQSTMIVYSTGAAAYRFFVGMDGTINATSTSIAAISDIRLKENVRDLDAGLDTILALKPRRFDWKEGKGKDVKDDMGFIAQEVEEVLPALIGGWKAGEGEPDDLKSVKAGDLIPVLVKAIQELTARVAQLEGK